MESETERQADVIAGCASGVRRRRLVREHVVGGGEANSRAPNGDLGAERREPDAAGVIAQALSGVVVSTHASADIGEWAHGPTSCTSANPPNFETEVCLIDIRVVVTGDEFRGRVGP